MTKVTGAFLNFIAERFVEPLWIRDSMTVAASQTSWFHRFTTKYCGKVEHNVRQLPAVDQVLNLNLWESSQELWEQRVP